MKVAYVFATNMATTFKLSTMILPQLEQGIHGPQIAGMMFFDDNIFALRKTIRLVNVFQRWPRNKIFF